MQTVKLKGAEFKELIAAVTKFPSVGTFVGSDVVSLEAKNGKLSASSFGVVLSTGSTAADGDVALFGIDERAVGQFASHCRATSSVTITKDENSVRFTRGKTTEVLAGISNGVVHTRAKLNGNGIKISWQHAKDIQYLSNIAMSDTSKPELNCVLLQAGRAIACGQKVMASLDCFVTTERVALPLPLIKALGKEDKIYPGKKETVLKSGIARYEMPTPVHAQKSFPYEQVQKYGKAKAEKIATISGSKLKSALEECSGCIAGISRLEVVATLTFKNNKLEITAENGGIRFRKIIQAKTIKESSFSIALAESVEASALFENKELTVALASGSVFLNFSNGWVLFSLWSKT
jgi:hypothetical protein